MSPTFVIVGAGMAGGKAVETLREEGFDGRVVLVGAEPERPYERPPLSKDYLRGEAERGSVYLQEDAGWYDEHDVEVRTSTHVESLDVAAKAVVLVGGERIDYDALLLATGAEPRRPPIPGTDLDGVHVLRSLEDSDALRGVLDAGGRLVVVGAGWIGSEVSASARQRGMDVALVEPQSVPLEGVLGPELGAFYRDLRRPRRAVAPGHRRRGDRGRRPRRARAHERRRRPGLRGGADRGRRRPADPAGRWRARRRQRDPRRRLTARARRRRLAAGDVANHHRCSGGCASSTGPTLEQGRGGARDARSGRRL
jgi:cation diffusion facilitator CzcD-associated flavoprotein CzcO